MTATAAAVAFVVYSCKGKLEMTGTVDLKATPVQTVNDMFVVQTENGLLQMRLESPLMERYENDSLSYELFPKGLAVYGYNEEGLLETELTSDNARHLSYKDGRESWEAFGNVVVRNIINRERMETDTHCYVKLYSPDGFMQGYGMESDQRARESVIKRPFNSFGYVNQDTTAVKIDSVNFIGPLLKK